MTAQGTIPAETMAAAKQAGSDAIEIRLATLAQLFNMRDPSPFRDGSLAPEAEEYLLQKVKGLPKDAPVRIVIHLPAAEAAPYSPTEIAAVVSGHFAARIRTETKAISELFRVGRRAALIGFATLSLCLFFAWHVTNTLPARPLTRIVQESFVILGWVSMWKPIEIFLYDWLPPSRRRRLLERLATAAVIVRS
jgi:hypothetical protein